MRSTTDKRQPLYVLGLLVIGFLSMWVPQEPIHQSQPLTISEELVLWMDEVGFREPCRETMEVLVVLHEQYPQQDCLKYARQQREVFLAWRQENSDKWPWEE